MTQPNDADPWFLEHGNRDAPLLLCLHGIGSCGSAFDGQAPLTSLCNRRLVAWDAPGYRNSPDPAQRYTLDDWADAAAKLVRDLGYESADVLGVSWGGVTGTRLALRHPDLVRSLILADSSTGSGHAPDVGAAMRARAKDVDDIGLERFAKSRSPRLVSNGAPQSLIDEAANMMIESVRQPVYTWATDSMADTDHRSELANIATPTLVVVGDQDQITPPNRSDELAAGIPGAALVTIADAGHLANQERPVEFNKAVAAFLGAQLKG